jgi:hypothetical protein
MTTPTITLYPDTLPAKGQANDAFDVNVNSFLNWLTLTNGPELQGLVTYTNDVANTVLATALAGDLPALTGKAGDYIRANAAEDGGEFRTTSQVRSDILSSGEISNRNLIINSVMAVAQRSNRAPSPYSVPFYAGPDRWLIARSGTGTTGFSRIANTDFGGQYAARATFENAATESWNVQQRIESINIAHLAGQEVTLSFFVTGASSAGSSTMFAALNYANTVDNFSADTEIASSSVAYTGTATKFTFTFTLPSSAVNGVSVVLRGVKTAATGTFTLTFGGVQLEAGDTATPLEHRSIGQQLAICQRYFKRYGFGNTNGRLAVGGWSTSSSAELHVSFPTTMRATPTLTAPNLGQVLDYGVSWHNVLSVSGITESTKDAAILNLQTQNGAANQGDSAALGGGGLAFDYLFDAEM